MKKLNVCPTNQQQKEGESTMKNFKICLFNDKKEFTPIPQEAESREEVEKIVKDSIENGPWKGYSYLIMEAK